jgi:hypothetical protein
MRLGFERNWKAKPKNPPPPYTEWEDYQLGMYGDKIEKDKLLAGAELLRDLDRLYVFMLEGAQRCPKRWAYVIKSRMNHQAWLGAIANRLGVGGNDATARAAYGLLTPEEQKLACDVADRVREEIENGKTSTAV